MKNLKKVLALVLAFACAFTMFASAAYSDQADIKNTDAVQMLSTLGIIKGYEDGTFRPAGNVNRAEMAKMIYTIRSGGNDDASAYNGVSSSFTDLNGSSTSWAAGYIKYCQTMGIIAGKSATNFDPAGNVTVAETAKMALVMMGYKADKAGLTGTSWEVNTLNLANDNGLLDGVTGAVSSAASRQDAAQILYNTINADCAVWSNDKEEFIKDTYTVGGNTTANYTVGKKYLGLQEWIGTFDGNSDVANLDDGMIKVTGSIDGRETVGVAATFKADFDLKYLGEEVSVLFKDATGGTANQPDKKDTIYGVYTTGATTVYNITKNDLQSQKEDGTVRFGDKNYDVLAASKDFAYIDQNYGAVKTTAAAAMTADEVADAMITALKAVSADTIKLICNENGKITKAYVVSAKIARVTAVNSEKVSINNGVGALKIADNSIYDGVAKDDIVVVSTYYKTNATDSGAYSIVTKADTVSGKLTGYNGTKKVTIDGTTYSTAGEGAGLATTSVDSDFKTSFADQIDESYTLYLIDGMVYAAKQTSDGAKNYAVVESAGGTLNDKLDPLKAVIMKADGSEATVEIHKDSIDAANSDTELVAGVIIKYSDVSDGKIKITAIATTTKSADAMTGIYNKDTKKFNGTVTATDAVLFVNKGGDFYTYDIRKLNSIDLASGKDYAAMNDGSKVAVAYLELTSKPGGASSDTVYGIVSAENGTTKKNSDTYTSYTVDLDADTQKTVLIEGASDSSLKKGDLVAFDVASDDIYTTSDIKVYARYASNTFSLNVANAANAFKGFAGEYESASILTYYSSLANLLGETSPTTVAVDDDVKVIYVNADDNKAGSDVGVIHDGINSKANFVAVYDEDNTSKSIIAIFVADDSNIEQ